MTVQMAHAHAGTLVGASAGRRKGSPQGLVCADSREREAIEVLRCAYRVLIVVNNALPTASDYPCIVVQTLPFLGKGATKLAA